MKQIIWNERRGVIIEEHRGRYLVDWGETRSWLLRGIGEQVMEVVTGRPRIHQTNADRQRAYRERVAGKPLRNYRKGQR